MLACLLCGLAFRTQQAWGAHAHRAHGYLSPAHQHAQGRRCPACGLTVANLTRLRKHFKTSAVCLQVAQGCFEVPTFPLDLTQGHLQFPATGGEARTTLPAARAVTCQPLARDLARLTDADDVAIFEIVKSHIEPLPVLRLTLQQWIDSLADGHLRASGQDVLLVLHAEHLCTGISGKDTELTASDLAFDPVVQPLPAALPVSLAPVAWTGGLCSSWLSSWSLGSHPTALLDWPLQPSGVLLDASAICCVVPAPPFPGLGFCEPSPCQLRSLRANRLWLGQTLSSSSFCSSVRGKVHLFCFGSRSPLRPCDHFPSGWSYRLRPQARLPVVSPLNSFSNGHVLRTLRPAQKKKALILGLWGLRFWGLGLFSFGVVGLWVIWGVGNKGALNSLGLLTR